MKKTLFAITMAAFTAMSLAACGSGSGKTDTTAAAGTEAAKEAGDAKKEETGAPAAAASGDSINVNRATDNGFLILLILSGGVVHGVQKDALWRRRAARGLRWKTDDSAVPVPAALARRGRGFRCR